MSKDTAVKPKAAPKATPILALVGGNLPDGTRFEKGDDLSGRLDEKTLHSAHANGIVQKVGS